MKFQSKIDREEISKCAMCVMYFSVEKHILGDVCVKNVSKTHNKLHKILKINK